MKNRVQLRPVFFQKAPAFGEGFGVKCALEN
jgi:hypothetical protein